MTISNTPTASEINVELGRASNAPFDINGAEERALAGKPGAGTPISFADFIGKSAGYPPEFVTMFPGNGSQGWGFMSTISGADPAYGSLSPDEFVVRADTGGSVRVARLTQGSGQNNTQIQLLQPGLGQPLPQLATFDKFTLSQDGRNGEYLASLGAYTPDIAGIGTATGSYFTRWTWANDLVLQSTIAAEFIWYPSPS